MPNQSTVLREGSESYINSAEIVVGDIVSLKAGERIPADIRIFETANLQVSNPFGSEEGSSYTCSVEATSEALKDSRNIVFGSACVLEGAGRGVVIHTGKKMLVQE